MSIQGHTQGYVRVRRQPEYWPEHVKNGKKTSSRLVIPVLSNEIGFKQEDGSRPEKDPTSFELTCWGNTADTYAKYLGIGKAFFCEFKITSYWATVFENRKPVMGADGKPLTKKAQSYAIIPGTIRLGSDGAKLIAEEKSRGIRPIGFDGKITVEELAAAVNSGQDMRAFLTQVQQAKGVWENYLNSQKNLKYTGGPTYGYAKVRIPADAQCAYSTAGGEQAAAVPPAPGAPTVDGFTYQQMIANGWTNEQLLTHENGKYSALVPQAMAPVPPAVSAPAAAPQAPAQSFEAAGV